MWVVRRSDIIIADETELKMADRKHKHNDGQLLAELRRAAPRGES